MNIREIARRASVSTATVSRVLNGSPKVSTETRGRILHIIEEMNYVPNAVARSMSHGRTGTLGLVLPDITNPFFPGIARGVEDTASAYGYRVILCNTDNERDTEQSYLRMLREQRVDGVVVVSSSGFGEDVQSIVEDIPMVWCDRAPEETRRSYVTTNHNTGVRLAVEHLLELGHEEIAMISGTPSLGSLNRQKVFETVIAEHGLAVPGRRILVGNYQYDSGYNAMETLLQDRTISAVFCANDMMAFGAMDAALKSGLRVPEDISIVGYDNILFAGWSHPALTTVSQPIYLLGVTAVELLMAELDQGTIVGANDANNGDGIRPTQRYLDPTLVVRDSTSRASKVTS